VKQFRDLPFLRDELAGLAARERLRSPEHAAPALASNDYLGLDASRNAEAQTEAQVGAWQAPWGARASRLVSGDQQAHRALESELVSWLGFPGVLTFSSGYAANVGALSALLRAEDTVLSDAENHASMIDGIRLSRARVRVFRHLDMQNLEALLAHAAEAVGPRNVSRETSAPRLWVAIESYFSMGGDGPDLAQVRALCDRYGALLYVDETHALGVFGPEGRGRCAEAGVSPDVFCGAFGKALGAQGGFIAGSADLRVFLWNCARSFMYSTGLSPKLAAEIKGRIGRVRGVWGDDARARLLGHQARLDAALAPLRDTLPSAPRLVGPIVPWILGSESRALSVARWFQEQGVTLYPIRPPTVAAGTCRLRFSLTATEAQPELEQVCALLARPELAALLACTRPSQPTTQGEPITGARAGVTIVVVGTGTDVGKTHVSEALLLAAQGLGRPAVAWKPVESGTQTGATDHARLQAAAGALLPVETYRESYSEPVSPHLEGRRTGRPFSLQRATQSYLALRSKRAPLLIELPGGLCSPLTDDGDQGLHLLRAWQDASATSTPAASMHNTHYVILVAPNRLGVLHDVLACLAAAQASGLRIDEVVLSDAANSDASSGSNPAELRLLLARPKVGLASPPQVTGPLPRAPSLVLAAIPELVAIWERAAHKR
jgi:8-amino-7-oxononanoate synthase